MDKLFYRLLMGLVKLIRPGDVNLTQLQAIVSTKMMMDRRRTPATWKQKQQKEPKNAMVFTFLMYSIFGLFAGAVLFFVPSTLVVMILLHSYLMFMLIMTLITDFSSVLLDNTDAQIIQPKPVSARTSFMGRALHIIIYLGQLLTALMIFPIIFAGIKLGILTSLVMIFTTLLTAVLAIFLTYLLYGLVIRFSSEQKVRDIVSYLQIFMTIFFAVGYQVIPRLINLDNLNLNFTLHWYSYLLPPVWMAMTVETFQAWIFDTVHLSMLALAIIVPLAISHITLKYLAPYFSSKLASSSAGGNLSRKQNKQITKKGFLSNYGADIICFTQTEKAAYAQTWKITARDKGFKMQFYPGLAYIPVLVFVIVFKNFEKLSENWARLGDSNFFIMFIYLAILAISTAVMIIPYNENYTAGWVYQSTPIIKPGELITGAIKSLWVKYFLPLYLLLAAFCFYIWGIAVVDDLLLGFFNNSLIVLLISNMTSHILPFSMQPNIKQQSGKFLQMILRFILIGTLILLHYLSLGLGWLVAALIPISALGCWLLLKRLQKLSWLQVSV